MKDVARVVVTMDTSVVSVRLIRNSGEGGAMGGGGGGKRERAGRVYTYRYSDCHQQNDSCIKMGTDKSHFNVSLIVRDNVTRQCPQTTTFEDKGEPKQKRTEVPKLTSLTPYRWAKRAHQASCCRGTRCK